MTNTNPFRSPGNFSPRIAAEVAAAYQQNLERSRSDAVLAGCISADGLSVVIKSAINEAKAAGSEGFSDFSAMKSPETQQAFEVSFSAAEEFFKLANITIPTPEDCVEAGINFGLLGAIYERMESGGLKPALVLAPNLDVSGWYEVYKRLVDLKSVTACGWFDGVGLKISPFVAEHWAELTEPTAGVPIISSPSSMQQWSLRLIPGTPEPTMGQVSYSHNQSVHPTIGEYLTLQGTILQAGMEPIDGFQTFTWLSGEHSTHNNTSRFAAYANWTDSIGHVNVNYTDVTQKSFRIGARLPEWK